MSKVRKEFKTWEEMEKFVQDINHQYDNHYNSVKKSVGVTVIFSNDSPWDRHDYTEEERTYRFGNHEKFWYGECCGYSLFASCPAERGLVRLEQYYRDWIVEKVFVEYEP